MEKTADKDKKHSTGKLTDNPKDTKIGHLIILSNEQPMFPPQAP